MGGKKHSYLGIDLGSASIKIVELESVKNVPKLITYGYVDSIFNWIQSDNPAELSRVVATVKAILSQIHSTTDQVMAALPNFAVFSSVVNLPIMSPKDLESAIQWEAKKIIPLPLEEVILDYKILNTKISNQPSADNASKTNRVLLTAAPRKIINKYLSIFQSSGLKLLGLETESFAMGRSLIGHDPASIMLLDLGANTSDIIIFEEGMPVASRSVNYGGENITSAIASNSGLSRQQAEQFKIDLAASVSSLPPKIKAIMDSITNEIKYSLQLYSNQNQKNVEKIILTGGSSFLIGLPQYLESSLGLRVFVGDPWARVMYPTELKPVLNEIAPRFSVALGLAMREI